MFILLSKILPTFVYPIGLTCILLLLLLFLKNKPKIQRTLTLIAILILWIGSSQWAVVALVHPLESWYPVSTEITQFQSTINSHLAEVIVLLGGGTYPFDTPRPLPEVNDAGDRLIYTAYLYNQGVAEHILLTGGRITWNDTETSTPAEEMANLLQIMGIPGEAMWLEDQSRNTYENALNCAKILNEKNIHRIVLVTSALHMPRAVKLFEHQGFEVIPAPTDYIITQEEREQTTQPILLTQLFNLMPVASNLSQVTNSLKEYLGLFVYWIRGWL